MFFIKRKRGMQLAISTLVLLILSVLILIALIMSFTIGWEDFFNKIRGYSPGELDSVISICNTQCSLGSKYDFCCQEKELGKKKILCIDDILKDEVNCDIDCKEISCDNIQIGVN